MEVELIECRGIMEEHSAGTLFKLEFLCQNSIDIFLALLKHF